MHDPCIMQKKCLFFAHDIQQTNTYNVREIMVIIAEDLPREFDNMEVANVETPAGYKMTELGLIPEDWSRINLGDKAIKIGSGITPTGGEHIYKQSGRPFVRSQNIGDGHLLIQNIAFIDDETHKSFQSTEVKIGDVLLNITGASIGRCATANHHVHGGNVNQHVCIIRPNTKELDSEFLKYFLLSSIGQRQINSFQAGGNREGLNFGQIRSFTLLCPSLKEQKAISAALIDVDSLINNLQQLISKKRDIKQAAMQHLLTGKQRLPGFSDDWAVVPFGSIATLRKTKIDPSTTENPIFCIELEHISQGTGILESHTFTTSKSSIKSCFCKGDILFGKLRAYLRKYWLADRNGVASTEIWPIIPNLKVSIPEYIFYIVQTDNFIDAASLTYGTHMPRSEWNKLITLKIPLPPLPQQQAIAKVLSDMDTEIFSLEQQLDKTRNLKQGIMQVLLTGRIKLI